ncbi:MAG: translocation/assembly module TamB domain-containing protein, partial [Bacillota bacterium]
SLAGTVPLPGLGLASSPAMDVRVSMERFPLELVQELLPAWQVEGGRLSGALTLTGTPEEPTASGKLSFQANRIASRQDLIDPLLNVLVELNIDGRHLRVAKGEARASGGGELALSGDAYLASIWPLGLDPVDLRLAMRQASMRGRPSEAVEFQGTFNGELRLAGALGSGRWPTLSGRIGVQQGRVAFLGVAAWLAGGQAAGNQTPAVGGPVVRLPAPPDQVEGRPSASEGVPLDVTVEADEPVRIEVPAIGGSGLLEGAVLLTGTSGEPALSGDVALSQARVRYFGREFTIERGRLSFSPARGMLPEVDLQASTGTPDGPVQVQLQGDVADLGRLRLSAQPEMSREQILALLLPPIGEPGTQPWVARVNEQLAAWATEPLERAVRRALGLDELWLVPVGEEGSLRLSVGKYISASGIYVRYRRELLGRTPEQELEFSYRLRPDLTLKLTLGGEEVWRLGLNWQWSF